MKTTATKFFQDYFKIKDEDMDMYEDTVDCLVKFGESILKQIPDSPIIHSDCYVRNCELLKFYKEIKKLPL